MRQFTRSALAVSMAVLLSGTASWADDQVTAWRLFVSDHAEPTVTVIDALDGDVLDRFTLSGPVALHRSHDGEAVYAVQGAAGVVTVISSGISFDEHGDHADIDIDPPSLTGAQFTGERPSHFVQNRGEIAAFFDLAPADVIDTASFYEEYWLKPRGKHIVAVCRSIACEFCGHPEVTRACAKHLDIEPGETTDDNQFTLVELECLGSCGTAPVMLIDETLHENVKPEQIPDLIEKARKSSGHH